MLQTLKISANYFRSVVVGCCLASEFCESHAEGQLCLSIASIWQKLAAKIVPREIFMLNELTKVTV